jgi:hypothetical protein
MSIDKALKIKLMNLTGSFETGQIAPDCYGLVAGNYDNEGLSWGVLQWNLGQKTLQPLWSELSGKAETKAILKSYYPHFLKVLRMEHKAQMAWAEAVSYSKNKSIVTQPWRNYLKNLGMSNVGQEVQIKAAEAYFRKAEQMASEFGLSSERALALMFDIAVQNGSIKPVSKDRLKVFLKSGHHDEQSLLIKIAEEVANTAYSQWREDVLSRKMTIAKGKGVVHGHTYDLIKVPLTMHM